MYLFHFSTCFEQPSAHHQANQLYQYIVWYVSPCVGDCLVCRSGGTGLPYSHLHNLTHFFHIFISLLCMFRATQCASSGESVVSIHHLVCITLCRRLYGMPFPPDLHTRQSPTQGDTYKMMDWYNWFSRWWALGCSKHIEKWNKYIEKVRQVDYYHEVIMGTVGAYSNGPPCLPAASRLWRHLVLFNTVADLPRKVCTVSERFHLGRDDVTTNQQRDSFQNTCRWLTRHAPPAWLKFIDVRQRGGSYITLVQKKKMRFT